MRVLLHACCGPCLLEPFDALAAEHQNGGIDERCLPEIRRGIRREEVGFAQGLELLRDQQSNEHFKALLDKVHQQVTTGVSLSDAFLSLGDVFPRLYANTLRAGERSGELESVLGRFVEYQRLTESVRRKIMVLSPPSSWPTRILLILIP